MIATPITMKIWTDAEDVMEVMKIRETCTLAGNAP
jgi:hypothetical protein